MGLTYRDVINAFQPAKEITDPRKFAGRRAHVERAIHGLLTEGAQLFVYGQRGIGKSSFARQVSQIAEGKVDILDHLGLPQYKTEKLDFLCLSVVCDDSIKSIDDLLLRSLTDSDGLTPWVGAEEVRKTIQDVRNLSVKPGGVGAQTHHAHTVELEKKRRSIAGTFRAAVKSIAQSKCAKDGLLLLIDEFDRVDQRIGFASILKSLAGVPFKCIIVGVADGLNDLVVDHMSLQRQVAEGAIKLEPMKNDEVIEVITRVESVVLKGEFRFEDRSKERIAELSRGQPYLVHLFGKASLQQAYSESTRNVTLDHLNEALAKIATEQYESDLEMRYRRAVASSPPRESVLRAFASIAKDKIHSSEAYPLCPDVEQPAVYVGHLRKEQYGMELIDRGNRYHEFRDALFKAYVNATPQRFETEPTTWSY